MFVGLEESLMIQYCPSSGRSADVATDDDDDADVVAVVVYSAAAGYCCALAIC